MGLVVLFFLLAYILLSLGIAIAAHFIGKRKGWMGCRWWTAALAMILIPTWDIPIGRLYFDHLCKTEAGAFIYQKVALPDEYFFKPGERNARYPERSENGYAKGGELNYSMIEENFVIDRKEYENYSFWGHIKKEETLLRRIDKLDELARAVSFVREGGWLFYLIFNDWPGSRSQCVDIKEVMNWHFSLPESVFYKKQG